MSYFPSPMSIGRCPLRARVRVCMCASAVLNDRDDVYCTWTT
jgi:hypothetical protein